MKRLLNKVLTFGVLAAFIAAVYIAIVVGIGRLFGVEDDPNLALSVGAATVVAFAFKAVRQRVQGFADRLIYGERQSPYEVLADFSRRMSTVGSVDEILPRMNEALAHGMGAERARVSIFLPDGSTRSMSWPPGRGNNVLQEAISVTHRGEPVGEVAVAKESGEPLSADENKLLQDLVVQAGLALHNARLNFELSARLEEIAARTRDLRASRQRIIAAQDVARRRLEREIRTGPELRLAAMADNVADVERAFDENRPMALDLLEQLAEEATDTLETLRDLARGIFPPLLADKGLLPALEAFARKWDHPVTVTADDVFSTSRWSGALETGVYFCCVQAVNNVAEHARGAPCEVVLTADRDWLSFAIADSGPGFDQATTPRGLDIQLMADRVEALGGSLEIHSMPERGTIVSGRVPLTSASTQAEESAQAAANRSGPNSDFGMNPAAPLPHTSSPYSSAS